MVTLDSLKANKNLSALYLPVTPYMNALCYILNQNENELTRQCKIHKTTLKNLDENLKEKEYWANKLSNAIYGEPEHFDPDSTWRIETPFNAEELFNLLIMATKNDNDIISYMKEYEVKTHDIDKEII